MCCCIQLAANKEIVHVEHPRLGSMSKSRAGESYFVCFIIIIHFISFILDFCVLFFYKKFAKTLLCKGSLPFQRMESKMETLLFFFYETRLISLVCVSTTLVKPTVFSATTSISLCVTSTVCGSPSASPISSPAAAPTFSSSAVEEDEGIFFFKMYLAGIRKILQIVIPIVHELKEKVARTVKGSCR